MEIIIPIVIIVIVTIVMIVRHARNVAEDEENNIVTGGVFSPASPDQVDDEDPIMRAIVATAWNTGKPVVGTRNDDGSVTIETVDHPEQ